MNDTTAPSDYTTAGLLMIVSATLTILMSMSASSLLLLSIIGIIFLPYYLLPIGGAIFELIGGIGAQQQKKNPGIKRNAILGLVAAVLCANVIGIALEIYVLVLLGKPDVCDYLSTP
jgi:hypothetical protein